VIVGVVLLALVAVVRIALTHPDTAQAFDEPCHVAAAIEYLDRHTYALDPVHPPLSRIAIGLPLMLAGERFPSWPASDPRLRNYNDVGNGILYGDGHYSRNLWLARSAIVPFFLITELLVFIWTRREFGDVAALAAVFLFTTLPNVLAFSGLAYTDVPAACTQFAALLAFARWLDQPSNRSTLVLGGALGLALLSKFTTLLFFPAAAAAMFLCQAMIGRHAPANETASAKKLIGQFVLAGIIAVAVVWGGYGFSVGRLRDEASLQGPQPSFQHFPGPVRSVAKYLFLANPRVPAPELVRGVALAWVLNKSAPESYLLGKMKRGGWWYFFLVGIAVKAPLPFLMLCGIGLCALPKLLDQEKWRKWTPLTPVACAVAILLITMPVTYNAGTRHVMVVFLLLAVIAGWGAAFLFQLSGNARVPARLFLGALLIWQGVSSLRARNDYISYFNAFASAGPNGAPSKVLVAGCDLDCGQDLLRLSRELQARKISSFHLAIWSSADLERSGLPPFQVLEPYQPVSGWVAVSLRSLRMGDVLHTSNPPEAYAWLQRFQPMAKVGNTILLYYLP
jgi:hypothetical protein